MNLRAFVILTVLVVVACVGSTAVADTVTFQEGVNNSLTGSAYVGTEDNAMLGGSSSLQNNNYGAADPLYFGNNGALDRHDLVRFDLTSLQGQYADVNSVTLQLFVDSSTYYGPRHK